MKKLFLSLSVLLMTVTGVNAAELTPAQEKAQKSIILYLQNNHYDPSIDTSDNSVCFRRNDVLYWITIDGESPFLYTIHRKGFKLGLSDQDYHRYPSIIAANEVNRNSGIVKLSVGEKKVDITAQVYASTPEAFNAVFNKSYTAFNNIATNFKKEYEKVKDAAKKSEEKKAEEEQKNLPPSELQDMIVGVSFRMLGNEENEVYDYDGPIRSYNVRFIQPRLEFAPYKEKEAKTYNIQLKITKPDGKVICLPGKNYTADAEITMEKSKKNQFFEIDEFGSSKAGFWKAGEYKVQFLESGSVFFTTTFNVL